MTESEALSKMIAPGQPRPGKMRQGVIQIMITRACDKACYHCTQNSQLSGKPVMMTPEQFEQACLSLRGYWGVVGVFGGNPAMSLYFEEICAILRKHFPFEQRGLWCNHPRGKGKVMRETFNPVTSNLNVHLDREAWDEFKRDWPESRPFGLDTDSRHSPCFVGMKDIGVPEEKRWELISDCSINKHWSALVGVFRGQLRAYFCEIAYAQAMLHENETDYPDTGAPASIGWWQRPMIDFREQVLRHCHSCSVPLHSYGSLAVTEDRNSQEQVSNEHATNYRPKVRGRRIEVITGLHQLNVDRLANVIDYVGNAKR